jgi:hypothetical protein
MASCAKENKKENKKINPSAKAAEGALYEY